MTTTQTFDPQTSGVIFMFKKGQQVGNVVATDVVVTDEHIWFTEVRQTFVERGHSVAKVKSRHRFFRSIKGLTNEFVSLADRPDLAYNFGHQYHHDFAVSDCD